jgi:hypothetical protein
VSWDENYGTFPGSENLLELFDLILIHNDFFERLDEYLGQDGEQAVQ